MVSLRAEGAVRRGRSAPRCLLAGAPDGTWCEHGRVIFDGFVHSLPDIDPEETEEWLARLDGVVEVEGKARARYLISALLERARELQVGLPSTISTPYVNTIPPEQQ